jgi:hypothetical protein
MKTRTHFSFRVDIWDDTGDRIIEHIAGVDDFEVAEATYRAAVARWPTARITLRQGARGSCMRAGSVSPRNDHDGCARYSYLLEDSGKRQANHDDSTDQ